MPLDPDPADGVPADRASSEAYGRLAPAPDFRYVGLAPAPASRSGWLPAILGSGATAGAAALYGFGSRVMLATALVSAAVTLAVRGRRSPRWAGGASGAVGVPMAIVPWGVIVEPEERARVLRWAAISRVHVDMMHGSDGGNTSTLWSFVTVEAASERLCGRAPGAVPLDRLAVHVEDYAREAAQVPSLDLAGDVPGDGPLEPEVEPLLRAAQEYVATGLASARLGLSSGGYRQANVAAASPEAVVALRSVLGAREARPCDPRAFAAVVAATLSARELISDLLSLVQSPHPLVAAIAKVAACKLGADPVKTGSLDEVAPFLMQADVEALQRWGGIRSP